MYTACSLTLIYNHNVLCIIMYTACSLTLIYNHNVLCIKIYTACSLTLMYNHNVLRIIIMYTACSLTLMCNHNVLRIIIIMYTPCSLTLMYNHNTRYSYSYNTCMSSTGDQWNKTFSIRKDTDIENGEVSCFTYLVGRKHNIRYSYHVSTERKHVSTLACTTSTVCNQTHCNLGSKPSIPVEVSRDELPRIEMFPLL